MNQRLGSQCSPAVGIVARSWAIVTGNAGIAGTVYVLLLLGLVVGLLVVAVVLVGVRVYGFHYGGIYDYGTGS